MTLAIRQGSSMGDRQLTCAYRIRLPRSPVRPDSPHDNTESYNDLEPCTVRWLHRAMLQAYPLEKEPDVVVPCKVYT
ncbi:hypothetical protein M3J09_006467 [Ascochyta lentis]